ncbi:hypothetical protein BZL30_3297 [Mycobacterium kansasii]|uniref:Uncharacterized protein n=1 Tax=Mycobacterium kansasii TaxID=1768 RepID=A0A1V3XCG5_MYCKA|nr:hypothetical protein BZL30_3297 [Mycobacterium kansasii]
MRWAHPAGRHLATLRDICQLGAHGASSYLVPDKHCDVMGADQHPADFAFADPPMHIDD